MTPSRAFRRPVPLTVAAFALALAFVGVVVAGPGAPGVRAGTSALAGPQLTVVRGTTTTQSSGWRFMETSPDEFPVGGFTLLIEIRPYTGALDGIAFDQASPPVFAGPGSLGGSASFAGPRTLRVDIASSAPTQLEPFEVTGLRLTASPTCGLGPIVATYSTIGFSGTFGFLPSIASTGGPTPTPTPTPSPSSSPTPSPSGTPGPAHVTTAAARVALGSPGDLTTGFRTAISAPAGARITLRATVRPIDVGRATTLYRRYGSTGTWKAIVTVRLDATGAAYAVTRATLPSAWTGVRQVQYRWYLAAAPTATAAWSDVARIVVK
jgi:hypothetical protein